MCVSQPTCHCNENKSLNQQVSLSGIVYGKHGNGTPKRSWESVKEIKLQNFKENVVAHQQPPEICFSIVQYVALFFSEKNSDPHHQAIIFSS